MSAVAGVAAVTYATTYATWRSVRLAGLDLIEGTRQWHVWYTLGVSELRQRYRRSTFGPLWVTLSVGLQALVMGYLLSYLFGTPVNRQLPYICISLVTWTFMMGAINEGAMCFIGMGGTIVQIKRPLWTYILLTLWRNAIIYLHTIIVFVITAIAFKIMPSTTYLLLPLGLALMILNMGWMALAAALLSARFRDVPLLISNIFTILIWLSPVYYSIDMLGSRARFVIELNPLTHILNVARAPYLNEVPALSTWMIALAVAVFGWAMTFALFVRTRARVPYWV